jgi:hypothetical protein
MKNAPVCISEIDLADWYAAPIRVQVALGLRHRVGDIDDGE